MHILFLYWDRVWGEFCRYFEVFVFVSFFLEEVLGPRGGSFLGAVLGLGETTWAFSQAGIRFWDLRMRT